jgi:nucleotide-binding universal stress UspA family protein
MLPIQTILYPTDFSPRSEPIFRLAHALARDYQARLVVLHVLPPPAVTYGQTLTERAVESERQTAQELMRRLEVPDSKVPVEHRLEEGDPAGVILEVAKQLRCDLIIMGTHGRSGVARLLMGSVAEDVSRKAGCPVITMKVPK